MVARMAGSYLTLLKAIGREAGLPIGRLELMEAAAREQVLAGFAHGPDRPAGPDLVDLIAEQVRLYPDCAAVADDHGELSYAELDRRANHLARRLAELGAGLETVVGVGMERSRELVIAVLAVLRAGAVYLPLDPEQPRARLAELVRRPRACVVLSQSRLHSSWGPDVVVVDADCDAGEC